LISWTKCPDAGVKYFSGAASYSTRIDVPGDFIRGNMIKLDLGIVRVIAQVKINGQDLGILWKPPFEIDITRAIKEGSNLVEVQVVNLWPNRLIGDEHLPEDCRWNPPLTDIGQSLAEWPAWLLENKERPSERVTFMTWKHWTKDSPLIESGLIGPVLLRAERILSFK
jgi:hypothetical protein